MKNYHILIAALSIALMDIYFYYQGIVLNKSYIYEEFNIMENLQAFFLLVSFVIYALTLLVAQKGERAVVFAGMLLWLTFFLREVDFEELNVPAIVAFVTVGRVKDTILTVLWLLTAACIVKNFSRYKTLIGSIVFSKLGLVVFVGGLMLVGGDMFEKMDFLHHDFYEEMLELNGYALILFGSLFFPFFLRSLRQESENRL